MALSSDVISFRLHFPEFKGLTDPDISAALDDADVWLDADMWSARDFPTARRLWAAHNLQLYAILASNLESMGPLSGFMNQALSTVAFGERRIGFRQLRLTQTGSSNYATGPLAQMAETIYGQKFLLLQSRNIHGILTV